MGNLHCSVDGTDADHNLTQPEPFPDPAPHEEFGASNQVIINAAKQPMTRIVGIHDGPQG